MVFLELKEMGLNEQEAFWLAEKRLGDIGNICSEYRKVNGVALWARRAQWMLIGYLVFSLLQMMIGAASRLAAAVAALSGSGWISFIVYGIVQIALLYGLVYLVYNLLFGAEPFLNALAKGFDFARSKSSNLLLATLLGAVLLFTGSRIIGSFLYSNLLDPYQMSIYGYGEMILNIVLGILLPALLISLLIQSLRKRKVLQPTAA